MELVSLLSLLEAADAASAVLAVAGVTSSALTAVVLVALLESTAVAAFTCLFFLSGKMNEATMPKQKMKAITNNDAYQLL